VLEIHPSGQVDPEKYHEIYNDIIAMRDKNYTITIENIFRRGDQAYAIYLTGLGFLSIKHIAETLL
jgi:ketosteroid isomerase-like protein